MQNDLAPAARPRIGCEFQRGSLTLEFLCACILAAAGAPIAMTQARADGDLTRLAEGVYARVSNPNGNAVSNAGVVVMERSVLVFDSHFTPEAGQAFLARIQTLTAKPARYLVNSHFHSDHTHGNQGLIRSGQFHIGTTITRRDILQKDLPTRNRMVTAAQGQVEALQKELVKEQDSARREGLRRQLTARQAFIERMSRENIIAPVMTFDDTMTIQEGSREVRLLFLGSGHTEGDAVLFLPVEKIAFLGDLFFNSSFPSTQDANILEWIKTLGEVLKLDAEKFVPGHGNVGDRKDVQNFLAYLQDLKSMVEPAVVRGDTLEQAVQDIPLPAKYSGFGFPNFFPANIQKMYAELKAQHRAAAEAAAEPDKKAEPEKPKP